MRLVTAIVIAHIVALGFGLGGLLIAVPNPHLWADSEIGVRVYQFGMQYAGGVHIVLAAIAMLLTGYMVLGLRRTALFFGITVVLSLSAELIGTTTGWPFGEYNYTSGLGYKILDEVPFTIPLSWFYMGLSSYLLAVVLVGTGPGWKRPAAAVITGATLLTIWDLVLDPAMAHQQLDVRFWTWNQGGLYFDMPIQNFLGWMVTGTAFIGLSRVLWRSDPPLSIGLVRVSYAIYLANLIFAMAISAGVGLWWPVLITIVIGVLPATVALVIAEGWASGSSGVSGHRDVDTVERVSRGFMTTGARMFLAREARLEVDGLSNIPTTGPAILVARHYHHLLDGCALQVSLTRPFHILVALDWVSSNLQRRVLEFACRLARWPMVIRSRVDMSESFRQAERIGILRHAMRMSIDLLSNGRVLVIFPEGYPNVDPHYTPKSDANEYLPFDGGFSVIAREAERRTGYRIPVLPVGFDYQQDNKWQIRMRIGAPVYLDSYVDPPDMVRDLEQRVRYLSEPARSTVTATAGKQTETT